ncbi:hypothetical protein K438DRAFT_1836307 [Mycena galopus ATCC 62051]|nr:hypothetical protein K438DRAFT_1836307 [Mycena galopus ATCC 62051]
MEKGWGRRKRRLAQSLGTACTADCEHDDEGCVCAAQRVHGGGERSVPGTPRVQSVYQEDTSVRDTAVLGVVQRRVSGRNAVYRRSAEGRVRHGQSVVTAPEAGCEEECRMTDMDFMRGVHLSPRPLCTSWAKKAGSESVGKLARVLDEALADGGGYPPYQRRMWMESECRSREVDAPEAIGTVPARGVGNNHAKLGDVVVYLRHSLAPDVVSACGVRALAKKLRVQRSPAGVPVDGCTLPSSCFGAWARKESVVHAVPSSRGGLLPLPAFFCEPVLTLSAPNSTPRTARSAYGRGPRRVSALFLLRALPSSSFVTFSLLPTTSSFRLPSSLIHSYRSAPSSPCPLSDILSGGLAFSYFSA